MAEEVKTPEQAPNGMYAKWGAAEHLFGKSSVQVSASLEAVWLVLDCDCGAPQLKVGMTLEMAEKAAKAMTSAIEKTKALRSASPDAKAPTVPGVFHA